jgi:hypothetical protein
LVGAISSRRKQRLELGRERLVRFWAGKAEGQMVGFYRS